MKNTATKKLFKIKSRTAVDYVEIGGYKNFNDALMSLYSDFYGYRLFTDATENLKKEYYEAKKTQQHKLIEKY